MQESGTFSKVIERLHFAKYFIYAFKLKHKKELFPEIYKMQNFLNPIPTLEGRGGLVKTTPFLFFK